MIFSSSSKLRGNFPDQPRYDDWSSFPHLLDVKWWLSPDNDAEYHLKNRCHGIEWFCNGSVGLISSTWIHVGYISGIIYTMCAFSTRPEPKWCPGTPTRRERWVVQSRLIPTKATAISLSRRHFTSRPIAITARICFGGLLDRVSFAKVRERYCANVTATSRSTRLHSPSNLLLSICFQFHLVFTIDLCEFRKIRHCLGLYYKYIMPLEGVC